MAVRHEVGACVRQAEGKETPPRFSGRLNPSLDDGDAHDDADNMVGNRQQELLGNKRANNRVEQSTAADNLDNAFALLQHNHSRPHW